MNFKQYTIAIFLILFTTQVTFAQVEKGDRVLGLNLSGTTTFQEETDFTEAGSLYAINLILTYERFITKNFSFGISPVGTITFGDNIDTSGGVGGNVFGSFSFLTENGKLLPYISAQYTYLLLLNDESDNIENGSAGPSLGLKVFFTEYTNIDIRLSYTFGVHTNSEFFDPNDVFLIGVGISTVLPRK